MSDSGENIDEDTRRLVIAITDFLRSQLDTRSDFDPEDRDCLEIAIQCLEMTYGLEGSGYTHLRFFRPLLDIFNQVTHPVSVRDKLQADFYKDQGNAYMRRAMFPNAEESYTNAIELDKWNAIYYCNRASSRIEQMNFFEAIADCRQALMLNQDYAKAHARMGQAYALLHRPREAARCFRQALELEPNNERYINNLSVAEGQIHRPEAMGLFTSLLNTIFGINPEAPLSQESTVNLPSSFMIITESHPATTSTPESSQISGRSDKSYQTDVQTNNLQSITFPDPYGIIDVGSEEQEVLRVNVGTETDRKMSSSVTDHESERKQSIISEPKPCEYRITESAKNIVYGEDDANDSPDKYSLDEKENMEEKSKTHQTSSEKMIKRTREMGRSIDRQIPEDIETEIKDTSKDTKYPSKDNEEGSEYSKDDITKSTNIKAKDANGIRQSHDNNDQRKSEMKTKLKPLQSKNTEERNQVRKSSRSTIIGDKRDKSQYGKTYEKYNEDPQSIEDKMVYIKRYGEKQSKDHPAKDSKSETKEKEITKQSSCEDDKIENGSIEKTVEKLIERASESQERNNKIPIKDSISENVNQSISYVNDKSSSLKVNKTRQDKVKNNNSNSIIPSTSYSQTTQSLPDVAMSRSKQSMYTLKDIPHASSQKKLHQIKVERRIEQPNREHSEHEMDSIKDFVKSHPKSSMRNIKISDVKRSQESLSNKYFTQKNKEKDINNGTESLNSNSKDRQEAEVHSRAFHHNNNIGKSSSSRDIHERDGSKIPCETDNAQLNVTNGSEIREEILDRINNLLESFDTKEDSKDLKYNRFPSEKDTNLQMLEKNGDAHGSRFLNQNKNGGKRNDSVTPNKVDPTTSERQASEDKEMLDKGSAENHANEKERKRIVYVPSDTKVEYKVSNQGKNNTSYINKNLNGTKKSSHTERYNIKLVVNDNARKHSGLKITTGKQESKNGGKKSTEIPGNKVDDKICFPTNEAEKNISSNSCAKETKELRNKNYSKNKLSNTNDTEKENSKTVPSIRDNFQGNRRKMPSEKEKESNCKNSKCINETRKSFENGKEEPK